MSNSPVIFRNGNWRVPNRKELWLALGTKIYDSTLDSFKDVAIKVLTEIDPEFELEPSKRYVATIYGKSPKFSPDVKKGVAETLALIGTQHNVLANCSSPKKEYFAALILREIFQTADWKLWATLNSILPILAQADPNEFLAAVESALSQSPCPFDELFSQEGTGFAGRNYLVGLLWALEALAWDEELLARVAVILAELSTHDRGGSWANRPINSLVQIFLPWFPHTTASFEKRMAAIKTIKKEYESIAWKLVLELLPDRHITSVGTYKPDWRKPIADSWEPQVTQAHYQEQIEFYSDIATSMAQGDIDKLIELIRHFDGISSKALDNVLNHLTSMDLTEKKADNFLIWSKLTDFSARHKRHSKANWALDKDTIEKIDKVITKFVPSDIVDVHSRLFSNRDHDLLEDGEDWNAQIRKLDEKRQEAIVEIYSHGGVDAIKELSRKVENIGRVGFLFGKVGDEQIDSAILPNDLTSEDENVVQLGRSYISGRFSVSGWKWVDQLNKVIWTLPQKTTFLVSMPFTQECWNRLKEWLGDSEEMYWKTVFVNPYGLGDELDGITEKLLAISRPLEALECLQKAIADKKPLNISLAIRSLEAAVSHQKFINDSNTYYIIEVIKALQDHPQSDANEIAKIEFAYLRLLDGHRGVSPKFLEQRIASDASFFCEAIRLVFKSDKSDAPKKEWNEKDRQIATNVWQLLHDWQTPPGSRPDGSFSEKDFKDWLAKVIASCKESGHLEVALSEIGGVLIHTPPDTDGLWINRAVAEELNRKDAEGMRHGFRIGLYNSRGGHFVDPTGEPERQLAAKYREQAHDVENEAYHRLAITLRALAESYEAEANRIIERYGARSADNPS